MILEKSATPSRKKQLRSILMSHCRTQLWLYHCSIISLYSYAFIFFILSQYNNFDSKDFLL